MSAPLIPGLGVWRRRAAIIGAVAVATVLALTVLFAVAGWFEDAAPDDPEPIGVGQPFRIGDFEYVVTGAHVVDEAPGVYLPRDDEGETDPSMRALVVEVSLTNVSETAWLSVTPAMAVRPPEDGGVVADADGNVERAAFFSGDGHLAGPLNPGVTVHGTLGWAQDASTDLDTVTVPFLDLRWVEEDPLTLDDQRWALTSRVIHTVEVPVDTAEGEEP